MHSWSLFCKASNDSNHEPISFFISFRPQDALLSSWCIHTKKNPLHQNTSLPHLESGEPAAKTLKTWIETLGEQIAGLKDTAFFNKQFSELLVR